VSSCARNAYFQNNPARATDKKENHQEKIMKKIACLLLTIFSTSAFASEIQVAPIGCTAVCAVFQGYYDRNTKLVTASGDGIIETWDALSEKCDRYFASFSDLKTNKKLWTRIQVTHADTSNGPRDEDVATPNNPAVCFNNNGSQN
jgi:hypothetical protein